MTTAEFVQFLRALLLPVEQADLLVDEIEGQQLQARRAAVLLPLFEQQGTLSLAFIRRASSLRLHSGEIAFPGGKVDAEDISPIMTALRETREEIGLHVPETDVLGVLPPVFTVVSNYLILPVVAFLPQGLQNIHLQESEVAELIVLPLHELLRPDIAHSEQWIRGTQSRTVYFYDYASYRIWGATGRILHTFLGLVSNNDVR